MKTSGAIIGVLLLAAVLFVLGTGLAMIVIGGIGHIFNIETFKLISFWETVILGIILGGAGASSSRSR